MCLDYHSLIDYKLYSTPEALKRISFANEKRKRNENTISKAGWQMQRKAGDKAEAGRTPMQVHQILIYSTSNINPGPVGINKLSY